MRLRELAEVKQGLKIDPKLLLKERKQKGIYFQYLQASDFTDNRSSYVFQKELRKIPGYSGRSIIGYGDLIIYKRDSEYKIFRYESISGQTVAGNNIFVISSNIGILNDYFSLETNRKYFCKELLKIDNSEGLTAAKIGEIEINAHDIQELEFANVAEKLGIRSPINFSDVPFNIYQKPLPIDKLLKRIDLDELLLETEFQRRPGLWDFSTKSRLIESMIIRLPLPAFYFDGSDDNKWLVIDGLQRLSAVHDFVNEKYVLTDLDYLPELENKSFSDLERIHQRNIEEFEIFAYIIQKGTPKSVTYKIFKNINTSALRLEPQEIRHALNPGVPATLLKNIAESEWFKENVVLTSRQRDRMEDRETALRFLAFQINRYTEYKPSIIDFLDASMTDLYQIPNVRLELYVQSLQSILETLHEIFDEYPFSRNLFESTRPYGHSNILFEVLTYGVSIVPPERRQKLKSSAVKQAIKKHFSEQPDRYWEYESAYTIENIKARFSQIEQIFKELSK